MRTLVAAACLVALPAAASAQQFHTTRPPGWQIGAEAGLAFTMGDTGKGLDAVGYDFIGRIGYEISIGLTPQLVVEYATFSVSNANASVGALEIMPGLRWSILAGGIRPWAAFNIGFGHTFPPTIMGMTADSQNGLAYNVGGGADFMVTTGIGFGVHLIYNHINISTSINSMNVDQSPQWLDLGAGVVITF